MRWVPAAVNRPNRCAAVPFIASHDADGFIDTGSQLPGWDPHVYVSVKAVREMARIIGMEPGGQAAAYDQALAAKDTELAGVREQLAEAERKLEAVQVLKSAGYSAGRKPGRPPKQKETV